jgi:hypothetical protein
MSSFLLKSEKLTGKSLSQVDRFLAEERAKSAKGRLIFALDATASRRPLWDVAAGLQAEMFREAAKVGGLELQLVYYGGYGECRASAWTSDPGRILGMMQRVSCESGNTQIGKVLSHTEKEAMREPVSALVFIGDAVEESPNVLVSQARELGRMKVPAFMFQEGDDSLARRVFEDVARSTGGAYGRFEAGAGKRLGELIKAAAIYAAGGTAALESRNDDASRLLVKQFTKA